MIKIDENTKYRFWAGLPIKFDNVGFLHSLTIRDIINIGYETYQRNLGMLLIDAKNIPTLCTMDNPPSTFELLVDMCSKEKAVEEFVCKALEIFFRERFIFVKHSNESVFYNMDYGLDKKLSKENYENFKALLKAQYCIPNETEEYHAGNVKAQELINKIKKNKASAPQPKPTITLLSMLSAIQWKACNGVTNTVLDLTIYQLYDAYYRLSIIDNYENTMQGIYSGNVDSKKIDTKKINWAKVLEI